MRRCCVLDGNLQIKRQKNNPSHVTRASSSNLWDPAARDHHKRNPTIDTCSSCFSKRLRAFYPESLAEAIMILAGSVRSATRTSALARPFSTSSRLSFIPVPYVTESIVSKTNVFEAAQMLTHQAGGWRTCKAFLCQLAWTVC